MQRGWYQYVGGGQTWASIAGCVSTTAGAGCGVQLNGAGSEDNAPPPHLTSFDFLLPPSSFLLLRCGLHCRCASAGRFDGFATSLWTHAHAVGGGGLRAVHDGAHRCRRSVSLLSWLGLWSECTITIGTSRWTVRNLCLAMHRVPPSSGSLSCIGCCSVYPLHRRALSSCTHPQVRSKTWRPVTSASAGLMHHVLRNQDWVQIVHSARSLTLCYVHRAKCCLSVQLMRTRP